MEKLNILLVDDQPSKLLTYEAMLADLGENLIQASTAREALELLLKDDFAVVLMDVNMPEIDGFELAALMRQHPRCDKTAIIFVSAVHLTDLDRVKGYRSGAVDYVSVPVVAEILRSKVRVFVDLYRKTVDLERLNRTLEERVSERTAELEASVLQLQQSENRLRLQGEALEEADRRKDEFLAMLAHELRNPLQPIRTAVEIMRQPEATKAKLEWGMSVIERQVNQLVRLVDDLLDASRISQGKLELRRGALELSRIVTEAVEENRPLAENKRHTVTVKVPKDPVYIDGDAVRLTQVFINLLNNAVKYTPSGGHISLAMDVTPEEAVVRIRDDGSGIPDSELPRIFDMFYQGESCSPDIQDGLGLGLALVRRLVEMHGGAVDARSFGRDRGSEFAVRLPRLAAARAPVASTLPGTEAVAKPAYRILVVDDNRDAAESLAEMLRMHGSEVNIAFDGAGAVAASEQLRPDVVLMDLGMPLLDGYAAARAIRRSANGNDVLLLAVTGWGDQSERRLSREAGFDRHFVKPVAPAELFAAIASLRAAPAWRPRPSHEMPRAPDGVN